MCSSLVHLYPANRIFGHLFLESSTNPFPKSTLFSGLKIGVHYRHPDCNTSPCPCFGRTVVRLKEGIITIIPK